LEQLTTGLYIKNPVLYNKQSSQSQQYSIWTFLVARANELNRGLTNSIWDMGKITGLYPPKAPPYPTITQPEKSANFLADTDLGLDISIYTFWDLLSRWPTANISKEWQKFRLLSLFYCLKNSVTQNLTILTQNLQSNNPQIYLLQRIFNNIDSQITAVNNLAVANDLVATTTQALPLGNSGTPAS